MVERASIEPATAVRRLEPRPDRGLKIEDAIKRTLHKHRAVLAALGPDTDAERAAAGVPTRGDTGSRNIARSLAR